jgi:hypothetical protein
VPQSLVFLKEPPITLAIKGGVDNKKLKEYQKILGNCILTQSPEGLHTLVTVDRDVNISHIRECSDAEMAKMRQQKEEMGKQPEQRRLVRPEVKPMFPGKRKK